MKTLPPEDDGQVGQGGRGGRGAAPSERTTLKRLPERGVYDRAVIEAILDEALVCHVGFAVEGQPFVIPTTYARLGDRLYMHGSAAGRLMRRLREGVPLCVTVTLLDGLVLARSAFHHSMNYRSVVILGTGVEVVDPGEKLRALEALVERVAAGRYAVARPPTGQELKATTVVRLPVTEASAKVRTGPPRDDPGDLAWPCWAGEIPIRLCALPPVADPQLAPGTEPPAAVAAGLSKGRG